MGVRIKDLSAKHQSKDEAPRAPLTESSKAGPAAEQESHILTHAHIDELLKNGEAHNDAGQHFIVDHTSASDRDRMAAKAYSAARNC